MKNYLLAALALSWFTLGFSQSYSNDRIKFVKEFQKALLEYGDTEHKNFAKDVLPLAIESGKLNNQQFATMVETCNLLESKRFKIVPEIYDYVYSVISLFEKSGQSENFNAFQSASSKLLESRNSKKFTDFVDMTSGYLLQRESPT